MASAAAESSAAKLPKITYFPSVSSSLCHHGLRDALPSACWLLVQPFLVLVLSDSLPLQLLSQEQMDSSL